MSCPRSAHRGSEWAGSHARRFREVQARVGLASLSAPTERKRLWIGAGLWRTRRLLQRAFEESHGAVFVWSMYLPVRARLVHPLAAWTTAACAREAVP